ncbi:hypothetical protein ZTR_11364 [Talaromyces verruculosus]|nr:hypothetical protein ZTR_11364 [Talaromyces verruculosus]
MIFLHLILSILLQLSSLKATITDDIKDPSADTVTEQSIVAKQSVAEEDSVETSMTKDGTEEPRADPAAEKPPINENSHIGLDFEGYIRVGLTTRHPDEIIDKIRGHMITTLSTAQLQLKVFFDDQEKAQDFLSELQRDEDDFVAPTHDAIQVYNQFKDTDFTAGPRNPGDERNEWEANKNLFAKALSTVQEKVIANTKLGSSGKRLRATYPPNPHAATPVGNLPLVDDSPAMDQQPTDSLSQTTTRILRI